MNVLITGAVGFIGAELLRTLLSEERIDRIAALIRDNSEGDGHVRLQKLIASWKAYGLLGSGEDPARIEVLRSSLESLTPDKVAGFDLILHTAASTDLGMGLSEARRTNLYATQRLLKCLRAASFRGRFVHFSTAYVAGHRYGMIDEDHKPRRFNNHYERSKWEAEEAVRSSGLPFTIVRPSIVVGRSDNGYVMRMKVLYSVWRAWLVGVLPRAPLDGDALVDLVPVDYVVQATLALASIPESEGKALHLCSGRGCVPTKDILAAAVKVFNVAPPKLVSPRIVDLLDRWPIKKFVDSSILELLHRMYWHLPYLGTRGRVFETARTDRLLSSLEIVCPSFQQYGQTMWQFCHDTSWGKRPRRCA